MERKELTNDEIISMYEMQDIINGNFKGNKEYGFDLDVDSFFLRCRNLKTQIYGLRVQAYLCTLLKYKTTPSSEDCGDFKTRENQDVELKCSFIDAYARNINVKQIRQWQGLDWYYCFTVDYSDYRNIIYKCYKLTKEQMAEECSIINAKPVHSTKKNNENNEKVELGFSIKIGSEHFDRWETRYLNKKLDLNALSQERIADIKTKNEYISEIDKYKAEIERLKAQLSDKGLIKEIEKEEIIEEVIENIINEDIKPIIIEDTLPVVRKFQEVKLSAKDIEKKKERQEAIKLIPQAWINELFDIYRNEGYNADFLYRQVSWKIADMKARTVKRRTKKEKESFNLNEWSNQVALVDIQTSFDDSVNALKQRLNDLANYREYLPEPEETNFSVEVQENEEMTDTIRRSGAVY